MTYLESNKAKTLFEWINQYETVIIHRHKRPDPDAVGSQLGLKGLIEAAYPHKRVLAAGTTTQGLSWLGQMDKIKVDDYEGALVIITDTANQARIDGEHYARGCRIVKIDHHPEVEVYGDLQLTYPAASSTSELITSLALSESSPFTLNQVVANLLYAGIVGDTGRFMFSSTSAYTHEMTAQLLKTGIDSFKINDRFNLLSPEELKLQGFGYEHLEVDPVGLAYLVITQEDMKKLKVTEEQTNSLVNLASRLEGIYAWVTFVQQEDNLTVYRCRIRSKGPIINEIASHFDGGGHPMASGANIYSQEERDALLEEMRESIRLYRQENEQEN